MRVNPQKNYPEQLFFTQAPLVVLVTNIISVVVEVVMEMVVEELDE